MFKVIFSKNSKSFLDKNPEYKSRVLDISRKFLKLISGEKEHIDIKKMKGDWEGFYRVRSGKTRIILSIYIDREEIYIERIGFRGDVFKDRK